MDFFFLPEQDALRSHIRQLLDDVCPPEYAAQCDEEGRPRREAFQALAENG